jgi:phytoene synthase
MGENQNQPQQKSQHQPVVYSLLSPSLRQSLRLSIIKQVREAKSSFYWAMRFLPYDNRNAIYSVYVFCREVDDIVDELTDQKQMTYELDKWREEIDALYDGHPFHPTSVALSHYIKTFDLPKQAFLDVITGMEMDVGDPIMAPNHDELMLYCDRVAVSVGKLCVRIFGQNGDKGDKVAFHLGRALQLTNILRDIAEDAKMGRVYLPLELLEKHSISKTNPVEIINHPNLEAVCRDLADEARQYFNDSIKAMDECDAKTIRPARIMAAIYLRSLRYLINRGWKGKAIYKERSFLRAVWERTIKLIITLKITFFG